MKMPVILIVDDEPDNFDVIETLLSAQTADSVSHPIGNPVSYQDYQLHYAFDGQRAIEALDTIQPDLILLDVMMPGLDGIEVCRRIKAMPKWQAVPIIMVTALNTKADLARCMEAGANDFVSKPVNRIELRARVHSMLRIKQQYDELQAAAKQQAALEAEKVLLLTQHNTELEAKVTERTAQLQAQTELIQHNALHDPLTDLPNRTLLLKQIAQKISQSQHSGNHQYAVLFLDLVRFKVINDSLGHLFGDRVLTIIAQKLKAHLQPTDLVSRFGGDEFVILLETMTDAAEVIQVAERILTDFQYPLLLNGYQLFIGVSIGIVLGNETYQEPADLIRDADIAMHRAKRKGENTYQVFDATMHTQALHRLTMESDLRQALERQELIVYYQPIVDILNDRLIGFEALVRWQHPTRGFVSPVEFVPIAEETGLIVPMDQWVLQSACGQLANWKKQFPSDVPLKISVNLSAQDLRKTDLVEAIDGVLEQTGLTGDCLTLEITESMLVEDINKTIDLLNQLKARKIQISIDDFGTGYSSLNYLHRLPADFLKIDRSFVGQMQPDNRNYQVVSTIIALSNQLGLATVAEGIETQEQQQWLQQLGCELGQGYLFSKPLAAHEIETRFFKG
jgi:diguanylate cyclase (GGDEF)-like protein